MALELSASKKGPAAAREAPVYLWIFVNLN